MTFCLNNLSIIMIAHVIVDGCCIIVFLDMYESSWPAVSVELL